MADIVTTQVLSDTSGVKYVAKLTNLSDGSGESLVTKVDASGTTFMSEDGERRIARVYYSVNVSDAKSGVELIWDGATNSTALFLSGQGTIDLRTDGNSFKNVIKGLEQGSRNMILGKSNKIRDDNDPMGRDVKAFWGRNKKWSYKSNITDDFEALYNISEDPFCEFNVLNDNNSVAKVFKDELRKKYID